jgi:flagellar motor switch protein FliN/FliY
MMNPQTETFDGMAEFFRHCAAALAEVFVQTLGPQWKIAGELRPENAEAKVQLWFSATGALQGCLGFGVDEASAVAMAQGFIGESESISGALTPEYREAIEELFRQVAGQLAAALRTEIGEFRFQLQPSSHPNPPFQIGAALEFSADAKPVLIRFYLDGQMVGCLKTLASAKVLESSSQPSITGERHREERNLELLLGIELPATICFGRKQMRLREILQLSAGAVIDLDRHVQEPVELLVDGVLIARGEVVLVDGNYGLRVTEIAAAPQARLAALS